MGRFKNDQGRGGGEQIGHPLNRGGAWTYTANNVSYQNVKLWGLYSAVASAGVHILLQVMEFLT